MAPVPRASDIIQALIERAPPRPPVERSTRLPYGWALWLRALPPLPAVARARPGEVAGLLAGRPPAPRARGEELPTWRAFVALFRQGWLPAPRDERPLRLVSGAGSLLVHLLFVAFLAWIAWMQLLRLQVPPEAGGGGERIRVGFTGAGDPGTPQVDSAEAPGDVAGDAGGEPSPPAAAARAVQATEAAEAEPAAPAVPALPQVAVEVVPAAPLPPPLPEVVEREVPEPAPPQPVPEQPVQVTEVEQPTIDYVLPPTTPRQVVVPVPAEPRLREREVVVVQAPVVVAPQVRPVDAPLRQPREPELRTREVEEPLPLPEVAVRPATVRAPQVEARLPTTAEPSLRERELPMPSVPEGTATAAAPEASAAAAADSAADAPAPATAPGAAVAADSRPGPATAPAPGPGTGQASQPTPGGSTGTANIPAAGPRSPQAGDDWGLARSGPQRPGGAPGLFDAQGRIRLPGEGEGSGSASGPGARDGAPGQGLADRGAPGGDNDSWTRERIAESGTWLKRPPYDYEPTSFDRYWVPNESLLAEWVRKGIKSVAIPIPGTSKRINCVVSLLQLGGGCGITDPNLNEQPSDGRPPPDIPFKPELQEDNGSVRP